MNRFSLLLCGLLIWMTVGVVRADWQQDITIRGPYGVARYQTNFHSSGGVDATVYAQHIDGSTATANAYDGPVVSDQVPELRWVPVYCPHCGRFKGWQQVPRCPRCGGFHP
jgi:hypothetical protein